MTDTNPEVDTYLVEGCGRCPLGNTPDCTVNRWRDELHALRSLLLDCGLTEERKWGVPCYTHNKRNVLLMSSLKNYCALSFLNGALLQDPEGLLEKPGENTQAARLIRFTSTRDITTRKATLKAYIAEAIALEVAGKKVAFKKASEPLPDELLQKYEEDPALKAAFEALTPGRQRGYLLHFNAAKQSKTRTSRIEKCTPKILDGKDFHDR